ncbi:hypothetical protein [Chloroflexus sp.]|uniref:hypothetical protein n=1 Tax=Chloroflexus sp. TaxID=1904827 RepID=UPI002ACDD8B4|nr:hypothetical protein [Chloroflexus sp.]
MLLTGARGAQETLLIRVRGGAAPAEYAVELEIVDGPRVGPAGSNRVAGAL